MRTKKKVVFERKKNISKLKKKLKQHIEAWELKKKGRFEKEKK